MQEDRPRRRLTRSANRMVGGVCAGIAEYFGVDPTPVRIGFALLALFSMGFPALLAYAICWAVMPAGEPGAAPTGEAGSGTLFVGIVLVVFGLVLLMQRLPFAWWFSWGMHTVGWPALLIGAGIVIVLVARRRAP